MIRRSAHQGRTGQRGLLIDRSGATLVEFAFVAPVLIMMIMGLFDIAHTQYSSVLLNGALQKAGRDLTLENAGSQMATVEARVRAQVLTVMPSGATVEFEELSHYDFADIGEPEEILGDDPFGAPGHGVCEAAKNERYIDSNENNQWDKDRGKEGIGGARDAVLYTAIVEYPRMFPMYGLIGAPKNVTLTASTVLRNQPFDEQDDAKIERKC
ncbi:MAG: pilus assembly protein [Sphingomonadales bacterium]|nr:pilus assembly protein [Sphingomonadales bacterium]NCQ20895.1 pilus assembly protein [Sphingomonadales bacterium]NCT02652.1 pilus assembly protein [Sphingomonadales bacterium]